MSASAITIKPHDPAEYQFATYIQDRTPRFKIHRTRGQAHQAISWRANKRGYQLHVSADCVVYQRNDTEQTWEPIHEFTYGQVLRCFPWQADPGSPEEQAAADRCDRLSSVVRGLEWQVKRLGFDEETERRILDAVANARANILKAAGQ